MGGDYAGLGLDSMAGMPYGAHFASGDQMYNIFVKPFADVISVAAGKTKEISVKAQTLLKVTFESVLTTLLPVFKDKYEEIFADEKHKIDQIKSEYAEVYQATWDAFQDADIMIAAFMFRPDLFITAQFARKAPKAAAEILSVLSGGALDNILKGILKGGGGGKRGRRGSSNSGGGGDPFGYTGGGEGMGMYGESVIFEDESKNNDKEPASKLEKLVSNDKVKKMLANSQKTQQMTKIGQELVQNTLKNVFKQAQAVLTAKSVQDLQTKLGKKLPGIEKLDKIPQQERQKAEQLMMSAIKKSMTEFYVKNLTAQVKSAVDMGVPQEHPYVKSYTSVISKINNL